MVVQHVRIVLVILVLGIIVLELEKHVCVQLQCGLS